MTNILITGARGNTGLPVVDRLAQMNVPFRAMVNTPGRGVIAGLVKNYPCVVITPTRP